MSLKSSIFVIELISKKGASLIRVILFKEIFLFLKYELKIFSVLLSYLKLDLTFVSSIFDLNFPLTKLFFLFSSNLISIPKPEFWILKIIFSKLLLIFALNFFSKISPNIKFLL